MSTSLLSRRDWLKLASYGAIGGSVSGWFGQLARAAGPLRPQRPKACILLWMNGGPSQTDTFDMKTGHANGGPFKPMLTNAPGLRICEHLPKLARHGDKLAVIRSMSSKEGDHGRGTHLMHTGYLPGGGVNYPTLGSLVAKELEPARPSLPSFVSINPMRTINPASYSAGFLGPQYSPLLIGEFGNYNPQPGGNRYDEALRVQDIELDSRVSRAVAASRVELLNGLERDFVPSRPDTPTASHVAAYESAVRLMRSNARKAFTLEEEPVRVREAYGLNLFGQGCLLARRLVEHGVSFVEVTLGGLEGGGLGWDTHNNNFDTVRQLCGPLDAGWSALLSDLKDRGMLDSTLVIWMGEFGRTPKINPQNGRDHYPDAWATVLAGGGVRGGQAYGATSPGGESVTRDRVTVPDFMGTVWRALGLDHEKANVSNGRPIRLADRGAKPVIEILG